MFGISGGELMVIVMVALVLFGPGQLPELARTVGRLLRQGMRIRDDLSRQVRDAMRELDREVERSNRPKPGKPDVDGPPLQGSDIVEKAQLGKAADDAE